MKKNLFLILLYVVANSNISAQETIVQYKPFPWLPTIWESEPPADCPFTSSKEIVGVAFTRQYVSYTDADTFYPSWASDDNMYCGWTDGEIGLESCQSGGGERAHTGIVMIEGDDPMNLKLTSLGLLAASALPYGGRYPCASLVHDGIWYFGTYGVDFDFSKPEYPGQYSWAICGPLPGFAISKDYGKTWIPSPFDLDNPLMPESGKDGNQVKLGTPHFVDFGKNMEYSPDGKAYLVGHGAIDNDPSPRVANNSWVAGDAVYMARVTPSVENINDITKYEFFAGFDKKKNALWSNDFSDIKPLLTWNNRMGCTTITYNPGLKKYIMCTTDGWPGMKDMNTYLLEADQITGTYRLITFMKNFGRQAYFVNLPSRFIDKDGRNAWMSYSANFNKVYFRDRTKADPIGSRYAWNLQEFLLLDKEMERKIANLPEEQIDPLKKESNIALRSRVTVSSVNKKFKIFSELIEYFGEGAVDGVVPWEGEISLTDAEKELLLIKGQDNSVEAGNKKRKEENDKKDILPEWLVKRSQKASSYKVNQWVSDGEKISAMIRLNWNSPEKVSMVWLFDNPGLNDQITSGMLVFSDGSTINVGELPNDARSCKQIVFDEKEISWIAFLVTSVSETTRNAGLAEFAVFSE